MVSRLLVSPAHVKLKWGWRLICFFLIPNPWQTLSSLPREERQRRGPRTHGRPEHQCMSRASDAAAANTSFSKLSYGCGIFGRWFSSAVFPQWVKLSRYDMNWHFKELVFCCCCFFCSTCWIPTSAIWSRGTVSWRTWWPNWSRRVNMWR